MMTSALKKTLLSASGLLVCLALVGCEQKGPMEKAGENLDRAGQNAADAINPKGPAEKAGQNVDKALGK